MKYYNISVNGVAYSVSVEETAAGAAPVAPAAAPAPKAAPAPAAAAVTAAGEVVAAPMPGNILKVNVSQGQAVKAGDVLVVLILLLLLSEGNEDSGSVLMTLAIFLFLQ